MKLLPFEKKMLRELGYFVRHRHGECYPYGVSNHTHGMEDTFGHPDLQIVYPMPIELSVWTFETVIELIDGGKKFKDGDISEDVIHNGKVKFVEVQEGDRKVLRIIVPDKQFEYERGKIKAPYDKQYVDVPVQRQANTVKRLTKRTT